MDGYLRIQQMVGFDCYNSLGRSSYGESYSLPNFPISNTRNKFTAIGCDTYALIEAIPKGVRNYVLNFDTRRNHSNVLDFNPCSYGFVVEDGAYNFSVSDLSNVNFNTTKFPIILDWTIGNQNCTEAKLDPKNYACKENSVCIDPENYNCKENVEHGL
ncbi:hypothetical protein Godav_009344 [Gossypium davidsonii]|uniref:Wall-associated receptor kinase galacturonan-binding domain-containing protein n=1 Tax=Gossypium davidsonii TaxID=34287 RepID=A0A7J8SCW0_GOSDV|nr:hypothetical protein [Gossypium davidsonii]